MKKQQTIFLTDYDIEQLNKGTSVAVCNNTILLTFEEHSKRAIKSKGTLVYPVGHPKEHLNKPSVFSDGMEEF